MIWPWSRIAELEGAVRIQARELANLRESLMQEQVSSASERHRCIGAEALAAERKEECQRLREDLAAARQTEREARDLMAKTLVDVNLRLTSPLQDQPPDMSKIREMVPPDMQPPTSPMRRHRQLEMQVKYDLLTKLRPDLGRRLTKQPAVAQENPPGEGERPSLGAVG